MAESEKKDSSTGDAKAKLSLLDEDFSKDFLSSWKSGGDDMDFNFEPVSKGKKKPFDFGMDMDFSLDDAFGKMSSFKMDMSDIDFSVSPSKSSKPKEKSEEKSAKGNCQDKLDKFNFSFDFDGMNVSDGEKDPGDSGCLSNAKLPPDIINASAASDTKVVSSDDRFSAEMQMPVLKVSAAPFGSEPTTGKTMLLEKKVPGAMNSRLPVVQATVDGDKTEFSASENNQEGLTHIVSVSRSYGSSEVNGKKSDDYPSSCTKELAQLDSVMEKSEKNAAACTSLREHDDPVNGKNKNEVSIDTLPRNAKTANAGLPSLDCEKMTNVKSSGAMKSSLDNSFCKLSSFKKGMPDIDFSNSKNNSTKSKEKSEEDSAKGNCLDNHDKFTFSSDNNVIKNGDGINEPVDGDCLGTSKIPSTTVNASEACDTKVSTNARSSAEMQKAVSKVSSTPFGREPILAKTMPLENKVPGAMKSKFTSIQANNDGCRPEILASEDNREGSTHMDDVNRSCNNYGSSKQNGTKSDDHPSSCTKEMIQSDSVLEKSEKNATVPTPRDHDNGKNRNEVSVDIDTMLHKGKEARDGLPSLECEKMTNSVKYSGFKIHSSTPPGQGTKFGNQGYGNLKDRISSITMIQKPNIGRGNKLSSQRVDKKMFALPSLKITRRTTTDKHPASPTMPSNAKSLGSVEKSTGLQAMIKTGSPVFAEKQTPSTPSLKRKPSEATDMGPAKLHMPKRFLPNESRLSRVSARELEDGVQTQGNFVQGSTKNVSAEDKAPKFDFDQEANMAALQFSLMVENDANVEKAEACAKELDIICNMLKKKHEEAKDLLVRALVNNNNLLMLSHPIYDEKICAVQRLAFKLMSMELEVEA